MNGAGGRRLRRLQELSVDVLAEVGPERVRSLDSMGISTVLDLLTTYPRRYIDRTRQADLRDLAVGDEAVVLAEVRSAHARRTRRGKALVELTVHDGTGGMRVVFFNQAWRHRQLPRGSQALFFGKLDTYRGERQMTNPVVDLVAAGDAAGQAVGSRTGRIVAVYPASAKAGLSSWELGRFVTEALDRAGPLAEPLGPELRHRLGLIDRSSALRAIHHPEALGDVRPARDRLAFDELLRLQTAVVLRRRALARDSQGIRHQVSELDLPGDEPRLVPERSLIRTFLEGLPFELTGAQREALDRILTDLSQPLPMHRLLQGDVGSGKTVVAVAALLGAVQGGHQGALMAPTAVLAEQHHAVVRSLTGALSVTDPDRLGGERPLRVSLLTNRTPASQRARIRQGLELGTVDLVVGTHALLTEDVRFRSLGVVVIDEQHRFGVEQRAALRDKGRSADAHPDLLVMTATPIPRTAAMVLFGDLDMTVLDESPPGRRPVETVWARTPADEEEAWRRVRSEVAEGRRAYVVCPLVEGSPRIEARSAVAEAERLARDTLAGIPLTLLHGQMAAADRDAAMASFREGSHPVMVATTVIEVGVDVPEATVMVIEDAQRFGIAQLHQLRGRVGRAGDQSWCFLLGRGSTPEADERLGALESSTDGFALAEVDLDVRGEGTILGARQTGRSDLRLASLRRDRDLLERAREVAEAVVEEDPFLAAHEVLFDEVRLVLEEDEEEYLFKS